MQAFELIRLYRQTPGVVPTDIADAICYKPNSVSGKQVDCNAQLRQAVTGELLSDFSILDILLIRELFKAELLCAKETGEHESLYQLAFYLYMLGQLEDVFLLYEAKYLTGNMDVSLMMDRYMLTVGQPPLKVLAYIKQHFTGNELRDKYGGLVEALEQIIENPEYDSVDHYTAFLQNYFTRPNLDGDHSTTEPPAPVKHRWKFW
jgi:hypothetical protein